MDGTRSPKLLALAALAVLAVAAASLQIPASPLAASSTRWDAASWDGARWDGARWDSSRWDGSRWDGASWDGSRWDAAQWDSSRWDSSRWDAAQWDAAQWDASRWDASFISFDPLYASAWGLRAIHAPGAWALVGPGTGTRNLCVIDSGVDATHPDLALQMWRDPLTGSHGIDLVDDDNDPMDVGGHGTHVASIAAARAGDGIGIPGVADARIMAVRALDGDGRGTDEDLAAGIAWCAANGADVISLSLSTDDRSKVITNAVKAAVKQDILVVASVGTTQCESCLSELAALAGVLGVTAVGPDGQLAPFASWPKTADLAAPGVLVPGAFPGNAYVLGSGTSQAVPHVSGSALLVWEAAPQLSAKDVARILVETASDMGMDGAHVPVVNAEAAVLRALTAQ